jgi:hypothetical protein
LYLSPNTLFSGRIFPFVRYFNDDFKHTTACEQYVLAGNRRTISLQGKQPNN